MTGTAARLPDGRLHLQEGPIDLVIGAEGPAGAVQDAYAVAIRAFDGLLAGLAAELPLLRAPADDTPAAVQGPVARRMVMAVHPHRTVFVTPMAAVAGAVADHVLAAMVEGAPGLTKAFVNDGGDIAFHLTPGTRLELGLGPDLTAPALAGSAAIPDSDLGDRPVVLEVGELSEAEIEAALDAGAAEAERMRAAGLIHAAALALRGRWRVAAGDLPMRISAPAPRS